MAYPPCLGATISIRSPSFTGVAARARAGTNSPLSAVATLASPIVERLQGFRERPRGDLPRFAVDDQRHTSAPARSNASAAARSANAGASRNPWR